MNMEQPKRPGPCPGTVLTQTCYGRIAEATTDLDHHPMMDPEAENYPEEGGVPVSARYMEADSVAEAATKFPEMARMAGPSEHHLAGSLKSPKSGRPRP